MRLIKASELNKLARIRVDIPNSMDSMWNIDIKKSAAALPDSIKAKLKDIVLRAVGSSERVFKYRGRKVSDGLIHVWDAVEEHGNRIRYYINRDLPLYKSLSKNLKDNDLQTLDALLTMIEDAFPYMDVYLRQSKEQEIGRSLDSDECFKVGIQYVETMMSFGFPNQTAINSLERLDYFNGREDVISRIRKEYSND